MKKISEKTLVSEETLNELLTLANDCIKEGVNHARKEFIKEPGLFEYRGLKSMYMNSCVKKVFKESLVTRTKLLTKIKPLKSHGMDYFLVEGKFLMVFKKMDRKGRVSGFYSKRFKQTIEGNKINYSLKMMDNLAAMGIRKPLPVYFVGHVINEVGSLIDTCFVNYEHGRVTTFVSLDELFKPNLFNIGDLNEASIDEMITVKNKKESRKSAKK